MKNNKNIGILLGAGFDKNFNLPAWGNLIKEYSSFLVGNIDIERRKGLNKVNSINNISSISLSRKYSLLKEIEEQHIRSYKKNEYKFETIILDINSYDQDNSKDINTEILKLKKYINIRIITTNLSNSLLNASFTPVFEFKEMTDTNKFLPIHGTLFNDKNNDKNNIVLFENQYLNHEYNVFDFVLSDLKELHIWGYSLNDETILKKLKEVSKTHKCKIYYYLTYKDEYWKELMKNHLEKIFDRNNLEIIEKRINNEDKDYIENFKTLIKEATKNAITLEKIHNIEENLGEYTIENILCLPEDEVYEFFKEKTKKNKEKAKEKIYELLFKYKEKENEIKKKFLIIDSYLLVTKDIEHIIKMEEFYKRNILLLKDDFYLGMVPSLSKNQDFLVMISNQINCAPFLQDRSIEEILSLTENVDISKSIIKGILMNKTPVIYYMRFKHDEIINLYNNVFKSMKLITKKDIKNIQINKDVNEIIIKKSGYIYSHFQDTVDFYYPYFLSAYNIIRKFNLYQNKDFNKIPKKPFETIPTNESLPTAGAICFWFFDKREKIIEKINKKQISYFKLFSSFFAISKNEINNEILKSQDNFNSWTITKDNFYIHKNIKKDDLKTVSGIWKILRNQKNGWDVSNIMEWAKKIIDLKSILSDSKIYSLKDDVIGSLINYLIKEDINHSTIIDFLRQKKWIFLPFLYMDNIKQNLVNASDIKIIIKILNNLENDHTLLYTNYYINSKKGNIIDFLIKNKNFENNLLKEINLKDSFQFWIEGLKFIKNMDFKLPTLEKDCINFMNSIIRYNPLKRFYEHNEMFDIFIKWIIKSGKEITWGMNHIIVSLELWRDRKSQIINSLKINEYFSTWELSHYILAGDDSIRKEDYTKEYQKYPRLVKDLVQRSFLSIQSNDFIEYNKEYVLDILKNWKYSIEVYQIHLISLFMSKESFSNKEMIETYKKLKKPNKNEMVTWIDKEYMNIDGITPLFEKINEETRNKLIKEIKRVSTLPEWMMKWNTILISDK